LKAPVQSQVSPLGINDGKIPNERVLSQSINLCCQNSSTYVPYSYIHFYWLYTKREIIKLINISHKLQLVKHLEEKTLTKLKYSFKIKDNYAVYEQ
jgi:hypothetical protein